MTFPRINSLKTAAAFAGHLSELGVELPFDEMLASGSDAPLAQKFTGAGVEVGNRFAILPMEGWDGTTDGRPTDLTRRRWRNFGLSGAKLIWGGEAVAVRHDGRANPNQLVLNRETLPEIAALRDELVTAHRERFGRTDDLLVGLQLTHSGRFARPNDKARIEPRTLYRHPVLDAKFGITDDRPILSDDEISRLIEEFVASAVLAQKAGYAFVDVKHCHGYLGHEFLSSVDRPGKFGGNLDNRTRFVREVVSGIRAAAPGLHVGVRLSVFDFVPFQPGPNGTGVPTDNPSARAYAFGADETGVGVKLDEPAKFLEVLDSLGVRLICTTAGSPYYTPHVQRPATFPPSDGYQPPEDSLVGVARQVNAVAALKARFPQLALVGSGYSYLQEWLPHVGQRVVRTGMADFIGLGRMVLSYPEMPADVIEGKPLARKKICRTFSECTTAPRNGMVSGCYPLDPFYKARPEYGQLLELKKRVRS